MKFSRLNQLSLIRKMVLSSENKKIPIPNGTRGQKPELTTNLFFHMKSFIKRLHVIIVPSYETGSNSHDT